MKISNVVTSLTGVLIFTTPALHAQIAAIWNGTGNWSDAARWSTNPAIPNNGQPGAGDTYTVAIPSGTVTQNLSAGVTLTGFTQSGTSTFTGGDLTVLSTFNFGAGSSPTMSGAGTTTIAAGATGTLGFGDISRSFVNHGTLAWGDARALGSAFTNGSTGVINVTGSFDVTGPLTNQGAITLNAEVTTSTNAAWTNSGTVHVVNVGGLLLQAGATTTGTYTIAAGSRFRLSGSTSTFSFSSTSAVSGEGSVEIVGGTSIFAGAYTPANTTIETTTTVATFNQTTPVTIQNLTWGGGTINGAANLVFTGEMSVGAGSTLSGSGTATIAAGANAIFSSSVGSIIISRALLNQGSLTLGDSSMTGGATITNAAGATFTIEQDVNRSIANDVVNQGTFVRTGNSGTTTSFTAGGSFTNAGVARVTSGSLSFGGGFTQTAGSLTLQGGNVFGALAIHGGTLGGTGTVTGNVAVTGGTIQPGTSAGTLIITGNLSLTSASDLAFEIGGATAGTQFDVLLVNGAAALDLNGADLVLVTINGFTPSGAQTFAILDTVGTILGAFDNVANGARVVTANGLGSFQVNYGAGSAFGADKVVLSNFAAVPEPGTWALLISGLLAVAFLRRRQTRP